MSQPLSGLALVVLLACAFARPVATAHAAPGATSMLFTVAGKESAAFELPVACGPVGYCMPRPGFRPAWEATSRSLGYRQGVRAGAEGCLVHLPDGRIVLCSYKLVELGLDGRLRPLRWPGAARLTSVRDLALGPNGTLIVLDAEEHGFARVWRLAPNVPAMQLLPEIKTGEPRAVAAGADGSVLVLDTRRAVVTRINPDGTSSTVAGAAVDGTIREGFGGDGGPATSATFNKPMGLDAGRRVVRRRGYR